MDIASEVCLGLKMWFFFFLKYRIIKQVVAVLPPQYVTAMS